MLRHCRYSGVNLFVGNTAQYIGAATLTAPSPWGDAECSPAVDDNSTGRCTTSDYHSFDDQSTPTNAAHAISWISRIPRLSRNAPGYAPNAWNAPSARYATHG